MRSLADVLDSAGWSGTRSEPRTAGLAQVPSRVVGPGPPQNIDPSIGVLVYSDAVPPDDPELVRARELGVPTLSYPQMLGHMLDARRGVAVAGTHGKSTTTAMAGEILATAGMDPTVVYGAVPVESRSGSRFGRGRWMLAEACEYRENFHHLRPQIALLLGIELDHVDYYGTLADVEAAFAKFVRQVSPEGLTLARADCAVTRRVVEHARCPVETFGTTHEATWQAASLRNRRGHYSFQLRCRRRRVGEVKMRLPGLHNVQNALAAAALASHCGASGRDIRIGLERFSGLRRRLEPVADESSLTVIDDYAHHPTEVSAALTTVRQMYPGRRVWCVFEPHQASRTLRMLDDFARALHNADKIIVADICRARETQVAAEPVTAADLVERTSQSGADVVFAPRTCDITQHLHHSLEPGDVVVTLGAGDIGAVAHDLRQGLRTIRKAG